MKKLFVILMLFISSIVTYSRDTPEAWINAGEKQIDCRKINFGIKTARVVLTDGEKLSLHLSSVNSYSVNGKVFVKMPLYNNNRATGKYGFMELLKTRGELSLFRLEISQITADETNETVVLDPKGKIFLYHLYKDDKLYMKADKKSLPNILAAYGFAYSVM